MTTDAVQSGEDRKGPGPRPFLIVSFVIPGLTYPIWPWVAPVGYVDPPWIWALLGVCFLSVPVLAQFRHLRHTVLMRLMSGIAGLVTLHLFVLASVNQMAPFYAVGSAIAVFATVIFLRSIPAVILFSAFVLTLAVISFAITPDERKLAYWGGLAPVLGMAYYRLRSHVEQTGRLEREIRNRTRQLSDRNRELRAEIDRRELLEVEVRVLHKMEAVGRLAGGVAHEFNNLLGTISIYTDLITDDLADDDPLNEQFDQIRHAVRHATFIVKQLLTLSHRNDAKVDLFDLNELVSNADSMVRAVLGDAIELRCELGEGPYPIVANEDQILQILLNLALNARDAMSGTGAVTIATSQHTANHRAGSEAKAPLSAEDCALLSVSDSGSGMSAETRERAFDPFFTTKDREHGTGLGLSIIHGIVAQAGGQIRLDSALDVGTRVEICWPLAAGYAKNLELSVESRPLLGRGEEILLVDDDDRLREAMVSVLTRSGYRVTVANDGDHALAIARERGGAFDVVVTDVVLPDMGEAELVERLSEICPETRVLLISRRLGGVNGDRPTLAMPFRPDTLIARLREILDAPGAQPS